MHISKMLRATIVGGALAIGGAAIGIAGAAAAPTSSTPTPSTTPSTAPAPAQKPSTPPKGHCPNMGSGSSGGAYSGPPPSSGSTAGYAGPGAGATYQ
jgi:hypothetical protein